MKATDFMVGDWLRTSRGIAKVIAVDKIGLTFKIDGGDFDIDRDDEEEWFDGIVLTKEVLEKIGFVELQTAMGRSYYEISLDYERYAQYDKDFYCRVVGPNGIFEHKDIQFVHDLQHLFRIAGIENKITL